MTKNSSQSGRSMVEMLGVIAIIGLITVAGVTSMGYVDSYFRSSATVIEIDDIAKNVIDTYSWSKDFSSLTMATICSEGILRCSGENHKVTNRWGGNISVAITEGDTSSFTITYTAVPKIPCEQLLNSSNENEFHYVTAQNITCSDNSTMQFILK